MDNLKSNVVLKRIGAYLIDYIIITFISAGLVYLTFINPKYEEYEKYSTEYTNILNDYYDNKISSSEFATKNTEISYDLNRTGYVYIIGNIGIAILYFGVFAFFTKGQTLGKRLMNIKIVSNKDKELKIYNYILRSIILNGVITNVITVIAICFSRNTYYKIYSAGSDFNTILNIIIFLMVCFNANGRGLHDIIAGTKVISTKEEYEVKEETVEEEPTIIKPKKKKTEKK